MKLRDRLRGRTKTKEISKKGKKRMHKKRWETAKRRTGDTKQLNTINAMERRM